MGDPKNSTQSFESAQIRKLMLTVRYTEAGVTDGLGMIEGAVKGADKGINSAKKAVNSALSAIPGIKMFIKEEKKDSTSDKKYLYDYKRWDKLTSQFNDSLGKLNRESKADKFEFTEKDFAGRVNAGKELFKKVKEYLSSHSNYKVEIYFIGIGQGGNVVNECLALLGADNDFTKENWFVKNVVYVATPHFKEIHKFDKRALKNKGSIISVYNSYDITHRVIEYFDDKEKLLKCIQDSNASELTFLVGKIQLEILNVIKSIATTLSNFTEVSDSNIEKKINDTKVELAKQEKSISDLIESLAHIIDPILDDLKEILDTSSLKKLEEAFKEFPNIPEKTAAKFVESITKKANEIVGRINKEVNDRMKKAIDDNVNTKLGHKSENRSPIKNEDIIQKKDLAALFECLKVPLETTLNALKKLGEKSPATKELADKLIARAGITKINLPDDISGYGIDISIQDEYNAKVIKKYDDKKELDKVKEFINRLCSDFENIAEKKVDNFSTASDSVKADLASVLTALLHPMFISKAMVLGEIISWLKDKDISSLLKDDIFSNILAKPFDFLEDSDFKKELQWYKDDTKAIQDEFNKIKHFFDRMNFQLMEDTLYFVYNSHNMVIQNPADQMIAKLAESTGVQKFEEKGRDETIRHIQTVENT